MTIVCYILLGWAAIGFIVFIKIAIWARKEIPSILICLSDDVVLYRMFTFIVLIACISFGILFILSTAMALPNRQQYKVERRCES